MHLNTEVALDLIEGRLDKDQEAFWKYHMESCSSCAQDLRRWRKLSAGLKGSHLRSAPNEDLEKAIHTLQSRPSESEQRATVRSILATIVFDNFLQPAMAGARGSAAASRQLVMRADDFDIHVKIWGDHNRHILGQLLPRASRGFSGPVRFHLLHNGERIDSTVTDELGEFHFLDVPQGHLSFQVDLPNLTVIGALNLD